MRLAGLILAAALFVSASAGAQTKAAPPAPPSPSPAPTVEPPPPYEPQLLRLAELIGALTYLRDVCHDGDGAQFRDKMAKLLDAEGRSEERKASLAGAFNRGFEDYQATYRSCTTSAQETVERYLDETAKIARDIATRYGG